jgi:hypothetical protein
MAKSSSSNNALGKIFGIFGIIMFVIIGLLVIAMAYILFAPDTFPKPFGLVYATQTTQSAADVSAPLATEIPTEVPTVVIMPGDGIMETMSTKIVNLAGTTSNQYIRVTIVLEFVPAVVASTEAATTSSSEGESATTTTDPNAELTTEIEARMPMMDDIVITLLSTKTYSDLYTADGKENLRSEIMNTINSKLPEFHVMSVYFTEFVVQ